MKGLKTRIFSAALAILLLLGVGFWAGPFWLQLFCLLVCVVGLHEYTSIVFDKTPQVAPIKWFFFLCGLLLFVSLCFVHQDGLLLLCFFSLLFFCGALWLLRGRVENPLMMIKIASGAVGLIYFVTFPALALKMIMLENGPAWFTFLLFIVFFGDTFAYFGGSLKGKRPLMPAVSPKKTIEGMVAGLFGSCLAGTIFMSLTLPSIPVWIVLCATLIFGLAAQSGDLFVSLVKRVAEVKDSGRIMPGHGGILDRLDGVYMAAPLVYTFAKYCQLHLS